MDKNLIRARILEALQKDLDLNVRAALAAREAATHSESLAEDKYDTRGLEASYLAGAQAKRAAELEELIHRYRHLQMQDFSEGRPIAATALVEVESETRKSLYFIAPAGRPLTLDIEGHPLQVITPSSALGQALLGKEAGEDFILQAGGRQRHGIILDVS